VLFVFFLCVSVRILLLCDKVTIGLIIIIRKRSKRSENTWHSYYVPVFRKQKLKFSICQCHYLQKCFRRYYPLQIDTRLCMCITISTTFPPHSQSFKKTVYRQTVKTWKVGDCNFVKVFYRTYNRSSPRIVWNSLNENMPFCVLITVAFSIVYPNPIFVWNLRLMICFISAA
jgi:hypothetical protein